VPLLVSLPGYLALGLFYLRISKLADGDQTRIAAPLVPGAIASNWKNILFFFYELLGFDGLGPPRDDLRIHPGIHSFKGSSFLMLLGFVACASLIFCILRSRRVSNADSNSRRLIVSSAIGLGLLFALARVSHFGFSGRHGMALVGVICCAFVLALSAGKLSAPGKALAIGLLCLAWTFSSVRLISVYRYGKDDPRAALKAAENTGLPILWNASRFDAAYYGAVDPQDPSIPAFTTPLSMKTNHWKPEHKLRLLFRVAADDLATAQTIPSGQYVFVKSRGDTFDPTGIWDRVIAGWNPRLINRFNGFDVWIVNVPANH
jgi:hypothetical protein